MTTLVISRDRTLRTITLVPDQRMLIQFDPYFRDHGNYEVTRIDVELEAGRVEALIYGRKVGKQGQYTSGERRIYNEALQDQAIERVERMLASQDACVHSFAFKGQGATCPQCGRVV